jgi:hypothetical protein
MPKPITNNATNIKKTGLKAKNGFEALAEFGIRLINLKYKEVDSKLRQNNGND